MTSRFEALREETRFRVLQHVSRDASSSQRDVSRELGVSLGMVNACLHALLEKRFITIAHVQGLKGRGRYHYRLTAKGMHEKARLARAFLARKVKEYEALKLEIEALQSDEIHLKRSSRARL